MSTNKLPLSSLPPAGPQARRLILVTMMIVFPGITIQILMGEAFIFFYSSYYKRVGYATFICLLLVLARLLLKQKHFTRAFENGYPTRWVRQFFIYPLTISLLAAMVVVAPLGWLIGMTWFYGQWHMRVPATVTWIEEFHIQKGCDQSVTLELLSTEATICLADYYKGAPLKENQRVLVQGKESFFGFLIQDIKSI